MNSYPQKSRDDYRKNHGVPGVVYILDNPGLRAGFYKIGCSRHSGAVRAGALNEHADTGTPGTFRCVFECRTTDCGRAEERIHDIFHEKRRGKFGKKLGKNERSTWGQEFFEVDLTEAKKTITQVCGAIDNATRKTQSVQIRASAPTTNAAKFSQSVYEAPHVIANQGNHSLLENPAANKTSNSGLFGRALNFVCKAVDTSFFAAVISVFFPVALVLGAILMAANFFEGENSPPPGSNLAQVTPIPVETPTPIENVSQWYPDTQPISSGMNAEGLGDAQNEADAVNRFAWLLSRGAPMCSTSWALCTLKVRTSRRMLQKA